MHTSTNVHLHDKKLAVTASATSAEGSHWLSITFSGGGYSDGSHCLTVFGPDPKHLQELADAINGVHDTTQRMTVQESA